MAISEKLPTSLSFRFSYEDLTTPNCGEKLPKFEHFRLPPRALPTMKVLARISDVLEMDGVSIQVVYLPRYLVVRDNAMPLPMEAGSSIELIEPFRVLCPALAFSGISPIQRTS